MKVTEGNYEWGGELLKRERTDYVVLHHAAASGVSAQDIHRLHRQQGWKGIAYHYYVRSDGSVYRGRPEDTVGAHTKDWNGCSIGICFEGNFESGTMGQAQKDAGRALVAEIRSRYPGAQLRRHSELAATACPGRFFPWEELTAPVEDEEPENEEPEAWAREACERLAARGLFRGDGSGAFRWREAVTRQELAVVLARLLEG